MTKISTCVLFLLCYNVYAQHEIDSTSLPKKKYLDVIAFRKLETREYGIKQPKKDCVTTFALSVNPNVDDELSRDIAGCNFKQITFNVLRYSTAEHSTIYECIGTNGTKLTLMLVQHPRFGEMISIKTDQTETDYFDLATHSNLNK